MATACNTGCLCFAAFSENHMKENNLPRIKIPQQSLHLAENDEKRTIDYITYAHFDFDGRQEKIYGYVIQGLACELILGKPLMEHKGVVYLSQERAIRFGKSRNDLVMRELGWYENYAPNRIKNKEKHVATATKIMETELLAPISSDTLHNDTEIFAVTMQDMNKALKVKSDQTLDEIKKKLLPEIKNWSYLFKEDQGSTLPPHRASDMKINLQKDEKGRDKPIP
ncbi:hypothetical protein K3495_g1852 [Podosphaera aphanis]|nr:hypothetical protein K3495_g1852 [Podosphaera aphanis]